MTKTFIILPTYNEAVNLTNIIPTLFAQLPNANILIVDDNSPDGTGQIADRFAEKYPHQIRALHRKKKEGLGKAYLAGFELALKLNADKIIQMDTDFSHPAEQLLFFDKLLDEYDFVLGSRYIPGGGTKNWPLHRQLLSRGGNLYARLILNSPVRDLTGGFKAFNRRVIEHILTCPIDAAGYSFQIETTSYAIAAGFTYKEVPFIFSERENGVSKMSKKIILEALSKVFSLRKKLRKRS